MTIEGRGSGSEIYLTRPMSRRPLKVRTLGQSSAPVVGAVVRKISIRRNARQESVVGPGVVPTFSAAPTPWARVYFLGYLTAWSQKKS